MSRIVVLNSGGFDSIVLMNYLHTIQGEDNIHSLHFLYGANNEEQYEERPWILSYAFVFGVLRCFVDAKQNLKC